ncbi:MAG TPA: sugar ABC transporter permease [Elusimicrobiota bacterium]|nr:sugar ABC transporter permease [Elusimicrobiota bacterium]
MKGSRALAWALLLPALVPLLAFVVFPAAQSLWLSFHEMAPFSRRTTSVGWENYRLLWSSPEYWRCVRVSFLFTAYTAIPELLLSLAIALALDSNPWFQDLFRTVFLLPVSISSAMAAMLWLFLYNPTAGYLNFTLGRIGLHGPNWLGDPRWALAAVAIATVWKELGFSVIFFLAGLAGVPRELHEAATLDGAGWWSRLRHVTLPLLSPTIFFVAVVSVVNSFQSFGQIHILTAGGPAGETDTMVYNLYLDAFVHFRAGYASAQSVILFLIILAATAIQFRIAQKRVHYG